MITSVKKAFKWRNPDGSYDFGLTKHPVPVYGDRYEINLRIRMIRLQSIPGSEEEIIHMQRMPGLCFQPAKGARCSLFTPPQKTLITTGLL